MNDIDPQPRRPLLGWDVAVVAVTAVMAVIGIIDALAGDVEGPLFGLVPALGVLLALVVLYAGLGRTVLRRALLDQPERPAARVFIAAAILVIGLGVSIVPSYATLQALCYPMIWTVSQRYWTAVRWSGVLAVAVGVGFMARLSPADLWGGLGGVLAVAGLSFAFAVVMGTWITRVFARGEQYRLLAEQLRQAQAEVAALSEASGASAERERLSRELHDTLTQTLTGLVMLSEQAERALAAGDTERVRDRLARVDSAARDAVREARALVATTQPLGDGGLEAAIERVAERLRADAGLVVRCELEPVALDRERQVVLLRAVQEGLANARRHARAAEVRVSLRAEGPADGPADGLTEGLAAGPADGPADGLSEGERVAVLTVEDDGVGPGGELAASAGEGLATAGATATAGAGSGFGLSGLDLRVRAVGGEVRFEPRESGGSRLQVRVPVPLADDEGRQLVRGGGAHE